jgi:hypothetical protein
MPKITTQLKGLRQAAANLRNVRQGIRNKILKPAVNEALKATEKAVRANVPDVSGTLRKAIGRKVKTYRSGVVVGLVGARKGFARTVTREDGSTVVEDPAKILHLIETGRGEVSPTSMRVMSAGKTVSYGLHAAAVSGQSVLEMAWEATKGDAEETLAVRIQRGIADMVTKGKM